MVILLAVGGYLVFLGFVLAIGRAAARAGHVMLEPLHGSNAPVSETGTLPRVAATRSSRRPRGRDGRAGAGAKVAS
jgi:hypothetical protein